MAGSRWNRHRTRTLPQRVSRWLRKHRGLHLPGEVAAGVEHGDVNEVREILEDLAGAQVCQRVPGRAGIYYGAAGPAVVACRKLLRVLAPSTAVATAAAATAAVLTLLFLLPCPAGGVELTLDRPFLEVELAVEPGADDLALDVTWDLAQVGRVAGDVANAPLVNVRCPSLPRPLQLLGGLEHTARGATRSGAVRVVIGDEVAEVLPDPVGAAGRWRGERVVMLPVPFGCDGRVLVHIGMERRRDGSWTPGWHAPIGSVGVRIWQGPRELWADVSEPPPGPVVSPPAVPADLSSLPAELRALAARVEAALAETGGGR